MSLSFEDRPMNDSLAKTVIASFGEIDAPSLHERLTSFDDRDWSSTTRWLHTSGLALYFLGQIQELGLADALPSQLVRELENNLVQNRIRTDALFREFMTLNVEFQRARLSYANLKGFTLVPHFCPDPDYRYQHDLDFLVSRRDAEKCRQVVERLGYRLTAVFGDTWEFRTGQAEIVSLRDLYKIKAQRSLEIHLVSDSEQASHDRHHDRLAQLQLQIWNGFEFPALCEPDKFLAQALHLFKHFRTEWTRTAWLLEYANAIRSHRDDERFWDETIAAIAATPATNVGIALATLVTWRVFGVAPPARFLACTVDRLPWELRLWVDHYQDQLVLAEHPGNKLYLLLQDILMQDCPAWQNERRRKLFPSTMPLRYEGDIQGAGASLRVRTVLSRLSFLWMRLRFHVTAGLHYKVEAARWKRFVSHLHA